VKIGRTIPVGGFTSVRVESGEHSSPQECARDLILLLQPQTKKYPILNQEIEELRKQYGIP
jgi:hypothetical protein